MISDEDKFVLQNLRSDIWKLSTASTSPLTLSMSVELLGSPLVGTAKTTIFGVLTLQCIGCMLRSDGSCDQLESLDNETW